MVFDFGLINDLRNSEHETIKGEGWHTLLLGRSMLKNKIVTACGDRHKSRQQVTDVVAHRDDAHQCNLGTNCGGRQRPGIVVQNFTCTINDGTHVVETKRRVRSLRL